MQAGLIGLGNAGQALAQALSRHMALRVYDRDPERFAALTALCGIPATPAASAEALARECDAILLSLPSPEASLAVAQELLPALKPGATIVETSTVRPDDVEALHDLLAPAGVRVIDAAIVGGVHKLADGKGVFLIGAGAEDAGLVGDGVRSDRRGDVLPRRARARHAGEALGQCRGPWRLCRAGRGGGTGRGAANPDAGVQAPAGARIGADAPAQASLRRATARGATSPAACRPPMPARIRR